jgi:hypothetical protein
MRKLKTFWLVSAAAIVFIATSVLGFAQDSTGGPQATAQVSTANDPASAAQKAKTFFGEPFRGRWSFTAVTSADAEYDDNILSSDANRVSDITSRFSLRVSAAVQKKRLKFQAHYFPNYVLYRRFSDRNAWTHQFGQALTYKVSARTDVNWNTSASRSASSTNTPFTIVDFDGDGVPVFRPETLQTDTTATSITNDLSISHRFSARNTLTVGSQGSFVMIESANGVPLLTTRSDKNFSSGVTANWDTEVVTGRKLGVQVGETYFGFLNPASHSNYQFVKLRFSQELSHGLHFSVGAGPSRQEDQLQTALGGTPSIDFAMDASLGKSGQSYSLGVAFHHGAQLGLTQASLNSDGLSFYATRQIGRRWSASSGFSYSRSTSTDLLQQSTDSYAPNGSLGYQISPELSATATYAYVNQSGQGILAGFDRNLFTIGLRYSFNLLKGK